MGKPGNPRQWLEKSHPFRAACILFWPYNIDLCRSIFPEPHLPRLCIRLSGPRSKLRNAKALDASDLYVRACQLRPHLLEHARPLFLWHGAGKARGRDQIPGDLCSLGNSGGSGPDDDLRRVPGWSERRYLWSHGVSRHNRSRDTSAALLRHTSEHSGSSCAVRPA